MNKKQRTIRRTGVMSIRLIACAILVILSLPDAALSDEPSSGASVGPKLGYGRDVRPILSGKCFRCHGFDEAKRSADLRLDVRKEAVADRGGTPAVVPFDPEKSEFIRRIVTDSPDERMPPVDTHQTLTAQEIETLKQWVREGAVYEPHWAFTPVSLPHVPDGISRENVDAGSAPIDRFVAKSLEGTGLAMSPEADRATLIRRLYFDVLGLLPTPEEQRQFINDSSPNAWNAAVDRVLANPHYGEHWGRRWLDQARYADSNGYSIDGARVMWPYRDWVIASLNEDLPFDQFTIEQLAGDLLPNATLRQQVASAFHRNTMINEEGGVKPDQFRHEALVDRVNTTGAVWLGLTVGCAQCHSHKYDPVSHVDYHRLYAFFQANDDANNQGTVASVLPGEMFGFTPQQRSVIQQLTELRAELKTVEKREKDRQQLADKSQSWLQWNWSPAVLKDWKTVGNAGFRQLDDGSLLSDQQAMENDTYLVTIDVPAGTRSVRLRMLPHETLPKMGPGLAGNGNFVLTDVSLTVGEQSVRFSAAAADHEQPDYPAGAAIDESGTSGWAINVGGEQAKKTPSLKMNAPHEIVLSLRDTLPEGPITLQMKHGRNSRYLVGRFAVDLAKESLGGATNEPPGLAARPGERTLKSLRTEIEQLESQVPGKGRPVPQMIQHDSPKPDETYLFLRGDFLNPDRKRGPLKPGVPQVLADGMGMAPTLKNRLELARWLVRKDNPLTARVAVNRIWMRYFGRGLVDTENDFGLQGSLPTHPELLDWLAWQFMNDGWSMKRLHRRILLSTTYRQAGIITPEALRIDPLNRLLARQSRLRAEAETVRDLALCASGLWTPAIGGPSVYPPQPDGVFKFTQTPKAWPESQGPDRYRRTMYTMFFRSAPHPQFGTFDAPDFSTVCTRRVVSNTPLQALALSNDPMFLELARGLAVRGADEVSISDDQTSDAVIARRMWRIALSREPHADELKVLQNYVQQERTRLLKDLQAARQLSGLKDGDPQIIVEQAVSTSVARVLLNLDEFITRN